ncbi:MAG: SHOCT domain-containing protein [Candidatus Hodarchaeota archaeon]
MNDVGSGLIKLAYRGFAGFFIVLIMFIFGTVGISLALAGGLMVALCWIPLAYPEILEGLPVTLGNVVLSSADAGLATVAIFVAGLVLLAVGFFFLAITFIIGKAAIVVDKEVAQLVDRAFVPNHKDRLSQLERLAALRNQGVLNEEEFQREKEFLLGAQPEGSKKF